MCDGLGILESLSGQSPQYIVADDVIVSRFEHAFDMRLRAISVAGLPLCERKFSMYRVTAWIVSQGFLEFEGRLRESSLATEFDGSLNGPFRSR